ncbi:hypothetical protein AAG906_038833 [Vitis piasezkii]
MSEKRDSASFPDKETKKKMKLDISSSSGSASDVNKKEMPLMLALSLSLNLFLVAKKWSSVDAFQRNGILVTEFLNFVVDLHTFSKRIQDDTDSSSQTKKTGSSSSSPTASASCSGKDQQPSGSGQRTLLYKKSLTHDDVSYCRLVIPLESCKEFLAEPEKVDGKYETIIMIIMDHEGTMWEMEASFDELSSSYMLWLNWDKYLKKHELEAGDVIFLYQDPSIPTFNHYLIEYEKRGRDSNPKMTST